MIHIYFREESIVNNNLKRYVIFITAFMAVAPAYSQTYNPPQMNQRQYRGNNNTLRPIPVIDYNRAPLMNQGTYNNLSGYQTPKSYALSKTTPIKSAYNEKQGSKDFGTEYYIALGYGMNQFEGSGLTSPLLDSMSNINYPLGDGKSFSIGFGAMANRQFKTEVEYSRLSGLEYGPDLTATDQICPYPEDIDPTNGQFFSDCNNPLLVENGGKISSNNFSVNFYLSMSDLFGRFLGGMITPYVGGGIGIAFNSIDDYTVYDANGYAEAPFAGQKYSDVIPGNIVTCVAEDPYCDDYNSRADRGTYSAGFWDYDGTLNHFGATTNSISWNVEIGLSFTLNKKTMLDVYAKRNSYGTVKSKDEVTAFYENVDIVKSIIKTDSGLTYRTCSDQALELGYVYKDIPGGEGWCESLPFLTPTTIISDASEKGKIENNEVGLKLRLLF